MAETDANAFPSSLDSRVLDILACPFCLGELRWDGNTVHCTGCGKRYPVVGGIPVLIAERATENQ